MRCCGAVPVADEMGGDIFKEAEDGMADFLALTCECCRAGR